MFEDGLEYIGINIKQFMRADEEESLIDPELVKHLEGCPADSRFVRLKY